MSKSTDETPPGNSGLPHSTVYRLNDYGRWEVDVLRGGLLVYTFRCPHSPATTPPTFIVGMRYGQRSAIAQGRDLFDQMEHGGISGIGDWLAFNGFDAQDEAA